MAYLPHITHQYYKVWLKCLVGGVIGCGVWKAMNLACTQNVIMYQICHGINWWNKLLVRKPKERSWSCAQDYCDASQTRCFRWGMYGCCGLSDWLADRTTRAFGAMKSLWSEDVLTILHFVLYFLLVSFFFYILLLYLNWVLALCAENGVLLFYKIPEGGVLMMLEAGRLILYS